MSRARVGGSTYLKISTGDRDDRATQEWHEFGGRRTCRRGANVRPAIHPPAGRARTAADRR